MRNLHNDALDFKLLESNDKRGVDTAFISKYKLKNPTSTANLYSHTYEDGDKVSLRGVSIYFGSVYTNGTNEGMDFLIYIVLAVKTI